MSSLHDFKVIQSIYFYNNVTPSELKCNQSRRDEIIIVMEKMGIPNPEGVE